MPFFFLMEKRKINYLTFSVTAIRCFAVSILYQTIRGSEKLVLMSMNKDGVADILNSKYQRHRHALCQLAISVSSAHLHCDCVSDVKTEPHKPLCYRGSRRL